MEAYNNLLDQIDQFIRKYYKNKMVKGLLFFILTLGITFLFITTLEYFGRFNSIVRGILLFSFVGINIYIFSYYFLRPLFKLFSFGKRISRNQAAFIIGNFFPDISDRLLNTLQLNDDISNQTVNLDLIRASVSQRASSLSTFNFSSSINIKANNRKYLFYILPLLLVFIVISSFLPQYFTQSVERVVYFKEEFKPVAPFTFNLNKNKYNVVEGEDLDINLTLKGDILPFKVYIVCANGIFLMDKTAKNSFSYTLTNIRNSSSFYFIANDYESKQFPIIVLGKSVLKKLVANISYPKYLGLDDLKIDNVGDIIIPEGTIINWDVLSNNTTSVDVKFVDKDLRFSNNSFHFKNQFYSSSNIDFILHNNQNLFPDTTSINISVVKDAYPIISLERIQDSISKSLFFFSGVVSDDYGLDHLNFVYTVKSDSINQTFRLPVKKISGTASSFVFSFDFLNTNLSLEDKVHYYFTITDNDAIHDGKTTKSLVYSYELPNLNELNDDRDNSLINAKSDLSSLMDKSIDFKKKVNRLKKDVLNNKSSDFNKLQQINELKETQNNLKEVLESIQNDLKESSKEMESLSQIDESISQKQELINELLSEVIDDELLDLLNKLEELIKKNDNPNLQKENVDDIKLSSDDMNKQLDRSIEMLKKLQVNEKIDAIEKELNKLSIDQNSLKDEIANENLSKDDIIEKQSNIEDRFNEIKEDLDVLNQLNKELSKPMELGNPELYLKDIDKNLSQAKEFLNKSKNSKASDNQKQASDVMKDLSEQLDSKQKEANKKQQEEDISTLRMILKNLITVSFNQEEVLNQFFYVNDDSPSYSTFALSQQKIIDNSSSIRDSLNDLAKRQPKIASFVDKELNTIFKNFSFITDDIDEHRKRPLSIHQQTVMTSFNNLALLLNESLESMQSQMNSDMPGGGSCDNPGMKGKPKSGDGQVGDMKELLKEQLEQMKKGSNPGGDQPGSSSPFGLSPKDFSKMAAQQSMIRTKLESIRDDLNKDGKGTGNQLNDLINDLNEQEKDLVNKKFSSSMINRQHSILTRLLESENALLERGFEDKRESKSGKVFENGNQIKFEEYKNQKLKELEFFRTIDPLYKKYYKDKANEFFNNGF